MAIRDAPRRELLLNPIYVEKGYGGLRDYVLFRVQRGASVPELAEELSASLSAHGLSVTPATLYMWIQRWRAQEQKEVVLA